MVQQNPTLYGEGQRDRRAPGQICTGREQIDEYLGGGIPKGALTLLEGEQGTAKSVLAQHIIWGTLRSVLTGVLYTTENTVRSLITQMDALNLKIEDDFLLGRIRIFPINSAQFGWQLLVNDMGQHHDADLFVIDSITPFVLSSDIKQVLTFFEACKRLCDKGKTIINVVHSYSFEDSAVRPITSLCDAHIRLGVESLGDKFAWSLEVCKMRGTQKTANNIIHFTVEAAYGINPIIVGKA